MFRVYTRSATDILNEVFHFKPPSNYNLRNQQEFTIRPMKTAHYELTSLAYLGPKIREAGKYGSEKSRILVTGKSLEPAFLKV